MIRTGTASKPTISVVMPAYNRARLIGAAISSVLNQSWAELELLVVDDGSTDGTAELVAAHRDSRITLVRQSVNAGAAAARNAGMARAQGELITFVDSDDLLFDDHLAALYRAWQHGGRGLATANAYYLGAQGMIGRRHVGPLPPPRRQRLALLQSNYCSPMSLFSRQLAEQIGPMDVTLPRSEDWDYWLRAVFTGAVVAHQPVPMAVIRRTGRTATSDRELVWHCEDQILRRIAARDDLDDAERSYLDRRLRAGPPSRFYEAADDALQKGRWREAAAGYRTAAELCPSEPRLVAKARVMRWAPLLAGPVLRHRTGERIR